MPASFQCAKCGYKANVKDELAGKKVKCPRCSESSVVGSTSASPKASKATKKSVPDDEENPFAALGDPRKFGSEFDPEDEDYEEIMEELAPKKKQKSDRPKKSKKPVNEEVNSGALVIVAMFALAGLGAIGAGAYYVLPNLMGGGTVAAPAEFEKKHHLHGGFYWEVPKGDGWVVTESENKPGIPDWLKVTKGSVSMRVDEDEGGSLIARTMNAGLGAADASATFAAAGIAAAEVNPSDPDMSRTLHDRQMNTKFKSYSQYEQGNVTPVESKFGSGRWCEYSFKSGFSVMKGMRATFYDGNTSMTITCECPEGNYTVMKPVFEQMIKSLEGVELVFQ